LLRFKARGRCTTLRRKEKGGKVERAKEVGRGITLDDGCE
jgi:hypothetical protein